MKKTFILLPLVGLLLYAVLSSNSSGPGLVSGVERTGATGSAGCGGSGCHSSSASSSTTVTITLLSSGVPVTTYTPGASYTIRLSGTQTSSSFTLPSFGYQVTAISTASGSPASVGTLSAPSGGHVVTLSGIKVIEHSSPNSGSSSGGAGTTYTVSIPWVAPSSGTGCVTLYGVLNSVNGNGGADPGDLWNNTSLVVNETVAAISGTTSVCSGSTSTLSDPTPCGAWSSSNSTVASVGTSSGVVTGGTPGTASISYTAGTGNTATTTVTVFGAPSVSGITNACVGLTTTLSSSTGTGTWTSGNSSVATVGGTSGVVTGISGGTATISFKLSSTGCATNTPVTINALPGNITGSLSVCVSSATSLSDVGGGTWNSGNTSVATINSSGLVSGLAQGTSAITYTLSTGCATISVVTVNPLPGAISGPSAVCPLLAITLSDASGPGTWTTTATTVSVGASSGIVSGISAGTAAITYTSGLGCSAATTITVNAPPAAITGTQQVCAGLTTPLSDATSSGTWTSGNTTVASISSSGLVNGLVAGTSTITYAAPVTGCVALITVTVNPLPAAITGLSEVCALATTTLSDASGTGTWSTNITSVAVINSGGTVTGISAGTTTITYSLSTGCVANMVFTVDALPGPITGALAVCAGNTTSLSDGGGGSWTSGNTSIATINSSGVVSTVATTGTCIITYTLPGTGCKANATVTVNPLPSAIIGPSGLCESTSASFSDATTGGTWSSGSTNISINSSGLANGLVAGSSIITYTRPVTGCIATTTVTVFPAPGAITGPSSVCVGGTISLTDGATPGGWTTANTSVATVNSSGIVSGVSAGTAVITYSLSTSGCTTTMQITVNPLPAAITGSSNACIGTLVSLSDATGSGTWSSANTGIATVNSSGVVSGVVTGTTTISYTLTSTSCAATKAITVNPAPSAITGSTFVCNGQTTALSDVGGGTWASGNTAIATVNSSAVVTGASAGTTTISYTLSTGCRVTTTVTVSPLSPITGTTSLCAGLSTSLSDATLTGTWTSGNTAVATINSSSGLLTSIVSGTSVISYTLTSGCVAKTTINVVSTPSGITGNTSVCLGATTSLSDGGGGTWASSNTTIAKVGGTGIVTGFNLGTATITYSLGSGCTTTILVTVNPFPAGITGSTSVCEGATIALSDGTPGGTWSSSGTNASVDASGIVTGLVAGSANISWTLPSGCASVAFINIDPGAGPIVGSLSICKGGASSLSDIGGGTWSSGALSVATIGFSSGTANGVNLGTSVITYTLPSTGCMAMATVTVNPLPGAITGSGTVCTGAIVALSDVGGGSWTSGNTNVSIDITTGAVTGISSGSSVITYTLPTGCRATKIITINPSPANITGSSAVCLGGSVSLSDATSGGTWTSGNTSVATINLSGVVASVAAGTSVIAYTRSNGCQALMNMTVNPVPVPITGSSILCVLTSLSLSDGSSGGTWSSANTAVASITPTSGTLIGSSVGTTTITYTLGTGCFATSGLTITPAPSAISGPSNVCAGSGITLSDAVSGGTWTSGNTAAATAGLTSGIISGLAYGTTTITYEINPGCNVAKTITVDSLPGVIIGSAVVCSGASVSLTDVTGGGAWSSANTGIAIAGSGSGLVSGIASGTTTITYTAPTGCVTTLSFKVNPSPVAITGTARVCAGSTTALSDATLAGTWSSASTSVATITSGGIVSGVSSGASVIAYTLTTGCFASVAVTVNPLPATITGGNTVCEAAVLALSDASTGGSWTSSKTAVATVDGSGNVTGVLAGTATVTYTLTTGCRITLPVTVNPLPLAGSISGQSYTCAGTPVSLFDATTGGAWSSGNSAIATVDGSGNVTAIGAGIVNISYSVTNSCGTANAVFADTIYTVPSAGAIAGSGNVCQGSVITLTDPVTGGVWSSDDPGIASVSGSAITGVAPGVTTISYTISTVCGSATALLSVTVNPASTCHVSVGNAAGPDGFKVYPNPTGGRFIVEIPASAATTTITILDMLGKTIDQRTANGSAQKVSFDISGLARGSYMVKIDAGTTVSRQKIELW